MKARFTITDKRLFQLRQDAKQAGFRVKESNDREFIWIIYNDADKAALMPSTYRYESWRLYEADFKALVNAIKTELDNKTGRY